MSLPNRFVTQASQVLATAKVSARSIGARAVAGKQGRQLIAYNRQIADYIAGTRASMPSGGDPRLSFGRKRVVARSSARLPSGRSSGAVRRTQGMPARRSTPIPAGPRMPRTSGVPFRGSTAAPRRASAVPRSGRMRRAGAYAKRNPFLIGGMGVALGYTAGNRNTGPGVTTTNTTGVYQY